MNRTLLYYLLLVLCGVLLFGACSEQSGDDDADDDADQLVPGSVQASPPAWSEPEQPLRSSLSLDGTWLFKPEGYPEREVQVPCFWEAATNWGYIQCPGYLDGTPDEGLESYEGNTWDQRTIHRGTYRLTFDLPDPAAVTRIEFESIHHLARFYLNDVEIGAHIGPYWKYGVDATAGVRPGDNELRIELTDGSALLGPDGVTDWPVGYYSHKDVTGIYRSVTLQELPDPRVDDVQIVPSTRRMDLTLQHTLVNLGDTEFNGWIVSRAVAPEGDVELQTATVRVSIPPHATAQLVVVEPWDDPILWSPIDPRLYTLRTLLMDSSGAPVDLREDRFGFREVWIEDGHYTLNGMRLNILGDNVDDQAGRVRYWAEQYLSCENGRETLETIKGLNVNAIRFHQAPPKECIVDLADELGLLVIAESAVFARLDIVPPFNRDPQYVKNAQAWIHAWVRQLRNHPAIVMWSVENEMWMYGFGLSKQQALSLAEPAEAADSILRPDGLLTEHRPVNWDGDSCFMFQEGLPVQTVNWHYPWDEFNTVYPADEWYDDPVEHFAQYLIPGIPTGVGETTIDRITATPEHSLDQRKAMQGLAVRALRINGFSDIRPYKLNWTWHEFDPEGWEHPWARWYHGLYSLEEKERLVEIIRDSYHPIAVFDLDYTRRLPNQDGSLGPIALPANTLVQRELVILNDSFMPDVAQTVSWSVLDETAGTELAADEFEVLVPQGENLRRTISFTTPAPGHTLTLSITSHMDGLPQGDYQNEYGFNTAD